MSVEPGIVRHVDRPSSGGLWRKLVPSHVSGAVLAIIGYILGYFITSHVLPEDLPNLPDLAEIFGFIGILLGWLIGVGAFELPFNWVIGKRNPTSHEVQERLVYADEPVWRYFRFCTDHKVIGIQYMVWVLFMLAVGGLIAMLMRAELLHPGASLVQTDTYNTFVSMHGMIMIATIFSIIVGPFGNFIVPIMIGARDMAFPRLNALSWHMLVAGVIIFLMQPFFDGTQTGWTFYAPLSVQTGGGADAFAFGVLVIIISSGIGAVNILTTVLTMRAPGLKVTRLPMTVWGISAASFLSWTATTSVNAALILVLLDRGFNTTFFLNVNPAATNPALSGGGSDFLYEQLFWFFGHPEVYILALPGFGVILDMAVVFSRKPLYTYGLSVLGIAGVAVISFLVWAHHLFNSGWQMELRGFYMGTTELISIPTGFVFLGILGTLWRGNLWMKLPLAWVLAFLWTFVIGGLTGIYLSDVPADIQLHGNFFVVGHFHYVILGSGLWAFFGGMYYWFPKMTGRYLDERLGWIHFWGVQIFFNLTFAMFFYLGLQGMPRRVADYSAVFQLGNTLASYFAFALGAFMLVFFANVVWSWLYGEVAPANPWRAKSLEWATPTPVPIENFEKIPVVTSGPYEYGVPPEKESEPAAGVEPAAGM